MEIQLNELVNNCTLKWLPWVGKEYVNSGLKILVVGESHYYKPEKSGSYEKHLNVGFTRDIIQQIAIEREYKTYTFKGKSTFFPNFHKALYQNDTFNSFLFWEKVCFYNFIQRPMKTTNERPSKVDFHNGWDSFSKMISIIKPDQILFIGSSAANYFNDFAFQSKLEYIKISKTRKIGRYFAKKGSLKINDKIYPIDLIKHTSAYFNWREWHNYIKSEIFDVEKL